jgi:membrane-bound ClpP family serine protease
VEAHNVPQERNREAAICQGMSAKERLDREFERLHPHLPDWAGRLLQWIRKPTAMLVRIPLAILLVIGGFLGFLPILGFWMVPLGLALIAIDVPVIRHPLARLLSLVTGWLDRRAARNGNIAAQPSRPTSMRRPE